MLKRYDEALSLHLPDAPAPSFAAVPRESCSLRVESEEKKDLLVFRHSSDFARRGRCKVGLIRVSSSIVIVMIPSKIIIVFIVIIIIIISIILVVVVVVIVIVIVIIIIIILVFVVIVIIIIIYIIINISHHHVDAGNVSLTDF